MFARGSIVRDGQQQKWEQCMQVLPTCILYLGPSRHLSVRVLQLSIDTYVDVLPPVWTLDINFLTYSYIEIPYTSLPYTSLNWGEVNITWEWCRWTAYKSYILRTVTVTIRSFSTQQERESVIQRPQNWAYICHVVYAKVLSLLVLSSFSIRYCPSGSCVRGVVCGRCCVGGVTCEDRWIQ